MKTVGKITATLLTLLALYVLGYWCLIKKDWLQKLPFLQPDPFMVTQPHKGIRQAFKPLAELDHYLNVELPLRKYLTGHWQSESGTDFVTLDANQVCRFQLGEFASEGKVKYVRYDGGFWMVVAHNGRTHLFRFNGYPLETRLGSEALAYASVNLMTDLGAPDVSDYHTTLTKQSPTPPLPDHPHLPSR